MNLYVILLILLGLSVCCYSLMFHFSSKLAAIRKKRAQILEQKLFQRMPLVAVASLMERKQYGKALEKIEELMARDPLNATLAHLKINCFYKLGKLQRALFLCDSALDVQFRDDPSFAAKKAEILVEMKEPDTAQGILADWLERHPGHPRLLIMKARLDVIRGRRAEAEEILGKVLEKDMSLELAIRSVKEFQEDGLLERVKGRLDQEKSEPVESS